jgi:hypothetical protein
VSHAHPADRQSVAPHRAIFLGEQGGRSAKRKRPSLSVAAAPEAFDLQTLVILAIEHNLNAGGALAVLVRRGPQGQWFSRQAGLFFVGLARQLGGGVRQAQRGEHEEQQRAQCLPGSRRLPVLRDHLNSHDQGTILGEDSHPRQHDRGRQMFGDFQQGHGRSDAIRDRQVAEDCRVAGQLAARAQAGKGEPGDRVEPVDNRNRPATRSSKTSRRRWPISSCSGTSRSSATDNRAKPLGKDDHGAEDATGRQADRVRGGQQLHRADDAQFTPDSAGTLPDDRVRPRAFAARNEAAGASA